MVDVFRWCCFIFFFAHFAQWMLIQPKTPRFLPLSRPVPTLFFFPVFIFFLVFSAVDPLTNWTYLFIGC